MLAARLKKMDKEIAILTAYYPAAQFFIKDAYSSIASQTSKDFDWIIINDGGDESFLLNIVKSDIGIHFLNAKDISLLESRWRGICWCKEKGYKYLIFLDADDWMSNRRVEASIEMLQRVGVVFSDLTIVSATGKIVNESIWQERFVEHSMINSTFIQNKNCIGLGNAAIDLTKITIPSFEQKHIVAVDWYLFYKVLRETEAIYISEQIFYRQHTENIAGIKTLSKSSIGKCIEVKKQHYAALIDMYPELRQEVEKLRDFLNCVFYDEERLANYIEKNRNTHVKSLWWEETNYYYE